VSAEQNVMVRRQTETGTPMADVTRQPGISEQKQSRWNKAFGGLKLACTIKARRARR
jgi:hypothetical protein